MAFGAYIRKKRDEKRIVVGEEEMLHIVADWTGARLAIADNNLGAGLKSFEKR